VFGRQMAQMDEIAADIESIRLLTADEDRREHVAALRTQKFSVAAARCRSCGQCFRKCPAGAISWTKDIPARIDQSKCVSCGKCFEACPKNFSAIVMEESAEVAARKSGLTLEIDPEHCRSCGICSRNCPTHAIEWQKKQPAHINQDYCVKCTVCRIVCPDKFNAVRLNGELKAVQPPAANE